MSAPARRSFWAESRQACRSAPCAVSRSCWSVTPPASLKSPEGPAGPEACAPPVPEPDAWGLAAGSGAAPVETGAVGGAALCAPTFVEVLGPTEPPPCVPVAWPSLRGRGCVEACCPAGGAEAAACPAGGFGGSDAYFSA
jgi:hypothetical protein